MAVAASRDAGPPDDDSVPAARDYWDERLERFGFTTPKTARARAPRPTADPPPDIDTRERNYALGVLRSEAAELAATPAGRNGQLNEAAYTCAAFVNTGALTRGEVEDALTDAGRAASLLGDHPLTDREIDATLRSGLDSGARDGLMRYAPDDGRVVEVAPGTLGGAVNRNAHGHIAHKGGPGDDEPEPTTWEPVDLGPWFRGEIVCPTATMGIARTDGLRLIYPGREHVVMGETESGKTWMALGCVAAELHSGSQVVYVHYEEGDPGSTIERLRLLGVAEEVLASRFRFVAPMRAAQKTWLTALLDPAPSLVVHDGVNEAMSLHGADIMAADGAATFRRNLIVPCTRAGAATLACDHLPMVRDGARRDAYGSVHKGNALDGARILLENVEPFGRGMRGVSNVFVTKDRPGHLRARGRPTKTPGKTFMGVLVVDDSKTYEPFEMPFYPPRTGVDSDDGNPTGRPVSSTELADIVHRIITALPERAVPSMRRLCAEMRSAGQSYRDDAIRNAADDLVVAGRLVELPGKRGATGYRAVSTASREDPR